MFASKVLAVFGALAVMQGVAGVELTGSFTLTSSDKFNEYMIALDIGFWTRTMANAATPTSTISKIGDDWEIKTETTFKTTLIQFKLGEEFDEVTGDGRSCKSTITKEGEDKLIHIQKCGTAAPLRITRQFTATQMTMMLYAPGGVVSTRVYKRD